MIICFLLQMPAQIKHLKEDLTHSTSSSLQNSPSYQPPNLNCNTFLINVVVKKTI